MQGMVGDEDDGEDAGDARQWDRFLGVARRAEGWHGL